MKRLNRRAISVTWAALLVLCGLPTRCFAVDVLKELSRAEATKLGIAVEAKPR